MLGCQKYKLDRPLTQALAELPHEWGFAFSRARSAIRVKKALTPKRGKKHQHTEPAPK